MRVRVRGRLVLTKRGKFPRITMLDTPLKVRPYLGRDRKVRDCFHAIMRIKEHCW
jgi:hypothetical protein